MKSMRRLAIALTWMGIRYLLDGEFDPFSGYFDQELIFLGGDLNKNANTLLESEGLLNIINQFKIDHTCPLIYSLRKSIYSAKSSKHLVVRSVIRSSYSVNV